MFNRYVAVSSRCFSCQGECLFSQVSEKHKHRGPSVGVAIFLPSLRSFENGTNPALFRNQTRYSFSSNKDSPHFVSTRPFKFGNWVEKKKKTTEITVTWSWQTNLFLQTGKEEKWSLCCKNKSSELRLRNLPRHVISPRDFYLQSHPQSLHIISLGAE